MATYCIPRSDVVALQDYVTRMNKEYPRRQKETKARLAFFEAELPKLMAVDTKSELVGVSHAFLTEVFTTFFAFLKTETPKLLQLALDVFLSLAKSHSPILEQFDVSDLDCNVVRVNRNMVCTLLTKLYALSLLNYPLARPVAETIVRIVEVVALAYNDVHFDDIREPVRILFLSGLIEFNLYKDSSLALSKVILSFNKKLDTYGRDFDTLLSYAAAPASASAEGGGAAAATAATAATAAVAAAALDPTVQEIMTLIRRPVFFPDDAVSNLFVHDMLYLLRYLTFLLSADAGCATPLTINRMLQIATADAVGPSTGLTSLFSTVEAAEILRSMALQCLVLLLSSANTHYLRVPEIRCYVTEVLFPLVYTRILPFYFADGEFVTFCYSLLELILRLYYRHTPAAFVRNYFEGFVLRVLNTPDLPSAEFKMSLLLHVGRLFSGDIPCKRPFDIEELESLLDYHGRCSIVLRGPDDAAVFQLLYCRPLEFFLNMYTTFDCSYHSSNLTERVIGCLVGYTTGLEKGQKYLSSVAGTVNVLRADAQAAVHPPFVLKQWRNSHLSYLHSGFVAALNRTSMTTLAKVVGGAPGAGAGAGAGADLRGGAHGGPCGGAGAGAGGRLAGSLPATEYVQALLTMSAACGVDLANLRASLNYVDPTQLACTNVSQCALYSITRISNGFASWYNAMAYRRHLRLSAFGRQGAADVFGAAFSFDGENAGRTHSKNIMTILKAHNSKREHETGFSLFETKPLKGIAYFEGKGALPALQRAPEAVPDAAADGSAEWRLRPASPLQRCPSPEPSTHMHAQAQAHAHHPSVDNDRSDEVSTTSTALTSSVADTLAAAIPGAAGAGTGTGAASAQSAIGMSADGERGAHRRRKRNFEEDFAASLQAIHAYYRQFTNAAEYYERLNEFIFEHATEDPEMSLGLSKTAIGELIGGSAIECRAVLLAYVGHFTRKWDAEYAETRRRLMPDQALREFLGTFRLPGEGQVIDRILIFLSHGYVSSAASYLRSHKTCHGLMFAIVMLNTDLHNTSLEGKRMSKESFIRNTARVDYSGELRGCREDGAPLHAAAADADADAPVDVHASAGAHAHAHADAQAAEVPAADAQPQVDVSAPPSRDPEVPPPAADADAHSNGNGNSNGNGSGGGGGAGTGADDDSGNNLAPRTPTEPGAAAAAVRALTPASASPRLPPASAGNASWLLSTIYDAIRDNPFTLNSIEKLSKLRMILDRHFMVNEGAGNLSRGGKDGRDANGRDLLNEVGPGHAEYAVRVARCISEWVAEADSNFALVAPPVRTPSQLLQPEPLAAGGPNGAPDAPGPVLAPPPPTRTNVVAVSVSSALLPPTREGTRLTCFKRAPTLYTGDPFTLVKEKYVPVFFESLLYKLDMRVFAAVQRFLVPIDRTLAATTFQICVEALLSLLYIFCNADGRQLAALRATSVQALVKMTVIPTVRNLGDDIENELSLFLTSSAAQAGAVTGVVKDVDVSVNILKVRLVEFLLNFALSVAESNRLAPRVIDHAAWYAQNFLSLLGAPAGAGAGAGAGTGAEGGGSVEGVSIGAIAAASAAASAGVGAPTASADAGAPGERATRLLPGGGGGGGGGAGAGTGGDPRERGRQPSSGSVRRVTASAIPRAPDAVVYHGKLVLAESWGDIIGLISRIQYFLLVMDKIHTGSLMAPVYALPAGSSRTFISMYASAGGAGPSPKAIIGDLARTAIPYSSTIYATNSLNSAVFSYATIQAGQALSYRDGRRHSPILTNSSEVLADAVQDYKQNLNCSDNFAKTVHYVSSVFTGRSVEQFFDSVLFLNETELIHIAVALAATSRDEIVSESELEYQTFSIVKLVDLLSYALDRSQGLFMKLWGQSGYHFAMLGSYSNHYLAQKGCDCLKLLTNAYLYKLHKRLAKLSMAPAVGGLTAAQRLGKAMSLVAAPVSASGAASGAGAGAARPPHVYEFVAGSDGLPRSSSLEEQPPRRSPSFDPDGGSASGLLGASTLGGSLGGTIGSALGSTLGGATDGSDDEYLADGPDEADADERADADPPSRTGSRHASQKSLSRSIAQANSFQAKLFQPFISIVSGTAFLEIIDFSLTCIEMFFVMFAVKPAAPTPVRAGALSLQMSLPLQQSLATDEETEPSAMTIGPGSGSGPGLAAGTAAAVPAAGGPSTNLSVFTPVGLGVIIKILTAAVSRTCADASFKNEAMKVSIVNRTRTLAKSLILLLRDVKSEYASIMFLLDSLREQALVTSIATETLWVMRSMLDTCWLDILGVVASFDHSDGGDERSLPGFLDSPQARNYIECFKILLEATFDPHPPVRAEAFVVVRKVLMMHFGVVFCDATLQHVWAVGPGADAGADAPAAGPAGAAVAPLSPGEAEGETEGETEGGTEASTAAPAKAAPAAASVAATGGSGGAEDPGPARRTVLRGQQHRSCELAMRTILREVERQGVDPCVLRMGKARMFQTLVEDAIAPKLKIMVKSRNKAAAAAAPAASAGTGAGGGAAGRLDPERVLADGCFNVFGRGASFNDMGFVCGGICDKHDIIDVMVDVLLAEDYAQSLAYVVHYLLVLVLRYSSGSVLGTLCYLVDMFAFASEALLPLPPAPAAGTGAPGASAAANRLVLAGNVFLANASAQHMLTIFSIFSGAVAVRLLAAGAGLASQGSLQDAMAGVSACALNWSMSYTDFRLERSDVRTGAGMSDTDRFVQSSPDLQLMVPPEAAAGPQRHSYAQALFFVGYLLKRATFNYCGVPIADAIRGVQRSMLFEHGRAESPAEGGARQAFYELLTGLYASTVKCSARFGELVPDGLLLCTALVHARFLGGEDVSIGSIVIEAALSTVEHHGHALTAGDPAQLEYIRSEAGVRLCTRAMAALTYINRALVNVQACRVFEGLTRLIADDNQEIRAQVILSLQAIFTPSR